MKLQIYSNGNGWYIPIGNYRDKTEEPIFLNINFSKNHCLAPTFIPDQKGKCKKTIYVNEGSLSKRIDAKGDLKLTLTIYNYDLQESTNNNVEIKNDELPFM